MTGKNIKDLSNITNRHDLIEIYRHVTQQEQNIYSFQVHVVYSPR
jgi:uncharacterized protein YvpB